MSGNNNNYNYKGYSFDEIDEDFLRQWSALMQTAIEPIAYLDPGFILSAQKHISHDDVYIAAIYRQEETLDKLVGLGVFSFKWGDKRLPFPYLQAYKTKHSYISGLLVDTYQPEQILKILFKHLAKKFWYCAGVRFVDFPINDHLAKSMEGCDVVTWYEFWGYERAVYKLPKTEENNQWSKDISKKRLKNYKKAYRDLEVLGDINWSYLSQDDIDQQVIDNYLWIEDKGWKGEHRSSLLSNEDDVEFLNALVHHLKQENKVFFTELRVNNNLIASTCNLTINDKAFAFKIGWDNDYKKYSPGVINEIEFLKHANQEVCDFKMIESGATEDSFIDAYWKQRWYLAEGVYAFNFLGRLVNTINNLARKIVKRVIKKIRPK